MKAKDAADLVAQQLEGEPQLKKLIEILAHRIAELIQARRQKDGSLTGLAAYGIRGEIDVWVRAIKRAGRFDWIRDDAGSQAFEAVWRDAVAAARASGV